MILSVEKIWVGNEPGVEGVCWIVNKGTPTELRLSIPMWTALDAGLESAKRARNLIFESQGMVPQKNPDGEIKRMNS